MNADAEQQARTDRTRLLLFLMSEDVQELAADWGLQGAIERLLRQLQEGQDDPQRL